MRKGLKGIAFVICASTAGCSNLTMNEGATHLLSPLPLKPKTAQSSPHLGKYADSAFTSVALPAKKNKAEEEKLISKGDAFSVHLLSAFVCDFRETSNPFDWLSTKSNRGSTKCAGGDGDQGTTTRGEIAIIANVGERSSGKGLGFNPQDIRKSGRVVYYNEDIRESGQLINALNIPVYGPMLYHGKPFFMDWTILEMDANENKAANSALKSLAEIGSAAYPPASPVLGVLNALGTSIIAANGDDVEMRYQFEFDPPEDPAKKSSLHRFPLREGYYALVRHEKRDVDPSEPRLRDLAVCDNSGFLCNLDGKVYRHSTWILLRIAREDPKAAEQLEFENDIAIFLAGTINSTEFIPTDITKALIKLLNKKPK